MPALTPLRRLVAATTVALVGLGTAAVAATGVGPFAAAEQGYATAHGLHIAAVSRAIEAGLPGGATPAADCGPGAKPEGATQGRVPAADYTSGRAAEGYYCNAAVVGRYGQSGGFQVHRYVDAAGHECAFYDATLLFPKDAGRHDALGTTVLDMTDPTRPVRTAQLMTPAMQSTHESLRLNTARGLLVAGMGSPATQVGFVDVYDVSADCRHPVLRSSTPLGGLGHEGGFSPDGRTYWVTQTSGPGITVIDLTDPALPSVITRIMNYSVHGMSFNADGTRAYLAEMYPPGLTVLDVSEIQARKAGAQVRKVGTVTWPEVSIPQNSNAVTIGGKPYLVEYDEYAYSLNQRSFTGSVGAARIIDLSDETKPVVVSRIRLQVHEPEAQAGDQRNDPGASNPVQGYAAHYCAVPQAVEPGIVACSMIASGLRVFDIRDPLHPREVAYANTPQVDAESDFEMGSYAMSAPAFVPERREVWYTDGNTGFFTVRLSKAGWPMPGDEPGTGGPRG